MTVWGYPVFLWGFCRSCFTYAEYFTFIGFLDEFNDVVEEFFFSNSAISSNLIFRRAFLNCQNFCNDRIWALNEILIGIAKC